MTAHSDDHTAMLALLRGLLVGAEQLIESADGWAARLAGDDPAPLVARFIGQLRGEWFAARPPDPLCAEVGEQVRARLAAWHPGWPHLWAHVLRVTGAALALAAEEGVDPALAYLAGMCHDVAKLDEFRTGEPHAEVGAAFAGRVLDGRLAGAQIAAIQAAILRQGDGPLADLLHDADKLDKIGAAGVVRRVSVETQIAWVAEALARVADDGALFPAMHFAWSADLAGRKLAFQAWFLPLARQAVGA